jgi:hypothetical protein
VNEVQNAFGNDEMKIAVELGGLPAGSGWSPKAIFIAAAQCDGRAGGWRNNAGTDWEKRQIMIKSFETRILHLG